MPGSNLITNPSGALGPGVTDYRTNLDANGFELELGKGEVYSFRANAAVTKGEALMFVVPTATVPLSVTPMTAAITGSDPWAFAGVALDAAAAAEQVLVMRSGFCLVQHASADTPAALDVLGLPATVTGDFETAAAAAGLHVVGTVLGAEVGTTNTCLAYVNASGVPVAVAA